MNDAIGPRFSEHVAYWSGQWRPFGEIGIAPDDLGFRQGATAVERLRTYGGEVFERPAHLDRWQRTVEEIGIAGLPDHGELSGLFDELLTRNVDLVRAEHDVGITLFATPGRSGGEHPTLGLHLNRLDFSRIERWRTAGQPLVITDVVQPDPATWPRGIKVRSRLHYYLADRRAREREAGGMGILLDQDGTLTETAAANIAIIEAGKIISPPPDRVLGGITQQIAERLAVEASIPWDKEPLETERARGAESVLLMGTDAGLWFACRIDGRPLGAGPTFRTLLAEFDRLTARR